MIRRVLKTSISLMYWWTKVLQQEPQLSLTPLVKSPASDLMPDLKPLWFLAEGGSGTS